MSKKRKTRQEKKIAELRRKLAAQKEKDKEVSQPKSPTQTPPEKTKLPPQTPSVKRGLPLQTFDKKEVMRDLLKTSILSTLAISLELVVYFILR